MSAAQTLWQANALWAGPLIVERLRDQVAGLRDVRLIHGRGQGVQRGIVQAALERHPQVGEFWDDADSHLGATFARLAPATS